MQYNLKDIELKKIKLKGGILRVISLETDYNIMINPILWEDIINAKPEDDNIFFEDDREQSWFVEIDGDYLNFRCNENGFDCFRLAKNQF